MQPGGTLSCKFWPIYATNATKTAYGPTIRLRSTQRSMVIRLRSTQRSTVIHSRLRSQKDTTTKYHETTRESKMVDSYHGVLRRLMAYLHEVDPYEKEHVFSQEELAALTPEDIKRWMCVKAYGMPEPGPNNHPTECRSTSIEFWKKAISSFMPNRLMSWNVLNNVGNPTKSIVVNDLIKAIKKREVRKQGKASAARRPLEHDEFQNILLHLRGHADPIKRYALPGFFVFQYNLIARMDDTCKFKIENLTQCHDFDFALKGRLCWSKNVNEERDAPNQIIEAE
jgi:hypothetical protein